MASANVELVREIYRAWEQGDFSAADWAHPEIEMVGTFGSPTHGLTETADVWRDWLRSFSGWTVRLEELTEVGDEVLALVRLEAHGKGSDVPIDQRGANVFGFRHGKVVRLELHVDREPLFERFGLKRSSPQ
ncbi:MAG: nuclear transport factor 2 family protein [Solirubrobacterales bacterium]